MFIETVPAPEAEGALTQWYEGQQKAWGFLPEYAGCFSSRPDVGLAWANLNLTIRGGMDRRRFELATVAAAMTLRSTYCAVAHATFLRDTCGDGAALEALSSGQGLSEQDAAIVEFASHVARDASTVTQADIDALHAVGLSDADVADLVFAVSARAFFTKVLDGLGARLDPELVARFTPEAMEPLVVGNPPLNADANPSPGSVTTRLGSDAGHDPSGQLPGVVSPPSTTGSSARSAKLSCGR